MRSQDDLFMNGAGICSFTLDAIPQTIALKDAAFQGRLRRGALVMLVGFGVGYSWGAMLVRWPGLRRSGEDSAKRLRQRLRGRTAFNLDRRTPRQENLEKGRHSEGLRVWVQDSDVVIAEFRSQHSYFLYPLENTRPGTSFDLVSVVGHASVRMEEGCRGFL
jgi:hypothetical protein